MECWSFGVCHFVVVFVFFFVQETTTKKIKKKRSACFCLEQNPLVIYVGFNTQHDESEPVQGEP